jgi:hydroxypyruvate isomerase
VPHRLPYLVNCSIMFTELPLLERPEAAHAAGFDAVEFWWPFADAVPGDAEVDAFVRAVRDAGVRLVGLNFFAGDMPGGDRGVLSWPGREQEFADSADVAAGIGGQLGVAGLNALYGNRIEGVDQERQDELATANLAVAAAAAGRIGAVALVEPVSGAPRYPLRTAADALAVVDRGPDNVALLADLYHLTVNGDDVDAVIAKHAGRIGHVQIADAPGRHEPGTGEIPLQAQLDALADAGYEGWVSLEYKPEGSTMDGLDWLPREHRGTRTAGEGA